MDKVIYIIVSIIGGFIAASLGVPAGWLIGSIFTGVIWGMLKGGLEFSGLPFKISLAFVATTIGLRLDSNVLLDIRYLLLPFAFIIILTIALGYLLSVLLYKKSDLDQVTAFFCCIPGGASEIIGISKEFGADERIVAAFHTVRITFFVITIPLIVGQFNPTINDVIVTSSATLTMSHYIFFPAVIVLTLFIDDKVRFPGGTLIFPIIISFLVSSYIVTIPLPPVYLSGIGQALIGGMVGVRFDKLVIYQLYRVGKVTIGIIGTLFAFSLITAYLFQLMTQLPYTISLLGTVPAGAAEMSATAIALDLSPSIIASLHIIRVLLLFLLLPFLIKLFKWVN